MASAITLWRKQVSARISGVPPHIVDEAVVDSIREFCDETFIWSITLSDIDVVADTADYDLKTAVPSSENICAVQSVRFKPATAAGGESDDDQYSFLTACAWEIAEQIRSGSWLEQTAEVPSEYFISDEFYIKLLPTPDTSSTDGIRVNVYAKPPLAATTVEDFFYRDNRDAITLGALYRLSEMDTAWGNMQKAMKWKLDFMAKCGDAKLLKYSGRTVQMAHRVRFPRFF